MDNVHNFIAQLVHRNVPFIYQPEDQFSFTTPADGIAVLVVLWTVEQTLLDEILCNVLSYFRSFLSGQPIVAFHIDSKFVDWCNDRQVKFLRESIVFAATTWSDMYDACTFGCAHLFPWNDRMNNALLGRKLVEWAAILPTNQVTANECFHHMIVPLITSFESF